MTSNEFYSIKDEMVFVPANKWFDERAIGELKEANQQYTLASMQERFTELVDRVNELKKEFDEASDKVRLAGKVVRTKSYLCTAKAIGDYPSLLSQLDVMEEEVKKVVDQTLQQKEQIVKEAEALLQATEWKAATETLRNLQVQFKALPIVPDLKNEELKDRFEKIKDEFFKGKQASFESFEQDLLDNLSKKIDLCEKAEALSQSSEWKKTTDLYIAMNEEWKKIGMVPKHRIEELWFRFSTAKDIFFARKKEHIGDIITEQEENLVKKMALIEKAEALKESKDWKKTSDIYTQLMDEWKKIGRVPQEKSDEIWNQFLAAKNHFYQHKDGHYSNIRVQLEDNFAKKMAIVNHAEELQNSNDFESATQEFMDMFDEWKKIGRIPKEHGDGPWERFLLAKKNFFDRKDANREKRKAEVTKDIQERVSRNRSYYNKISKELQREEELLFDVNDRLQNLPPTLRSYEKREEYLEMIEEIKEKVEELKAKCREVKEKVQQDEREINYILRGPRKKENNESKSVAAKAPAEVADVESASEATVTAPISETPVESNNAEAADAEAPSEI
ncbi:MAG TPA: DUF349 domain-containing protein [Chitinophagaceae bacterium]|nr:DUF349 domain-containing protein [Chitinophagaceae bacterium]